MKTSIGIGDPTSSLPMKKISIVGNTIYGSAGYVRLENYLNSNGTVNDILKKESNFDLAWMKINDSIMKQLYGVIDMFKGRNMINDLPVNTGYDFLEIITATYLKDTPTVRWAGYYYTVENGQITPKIRNDTSRKSFIPTLLQFGFYDSISTYISNNEQYFEEGDIVNKLICLIDMESKNPNSSKMIGKPFDVGIISPTKLPRWIIPKTSCTLK
jgi:hypothetical protein